MGLTSSTPVGSEDQFTVAKEIAGAYEAAMQEEIRKENATGAYAGGCGCEDKKLGSADGMDLADASNYVDSINSKSKTRIIESILDAASKLGLKPEGSSPAARIKSLLANIPVGERFKTDAQAGVCANIAKAINAAYGVKVIETALPGDALCQHIAEILSSLGAGTHTEFLAVYNDVQKVLKNLSILREQLDADMKQMKEKISQSEDQVVAKSLQLNFDLYEMLVQEVKRQIQLLSNLLNVHLMPSAGDLAKLLKDKKELHGWIKKIDLKPGSDKFGRVISDLLRGLGVTANFMLIIEQALSTVGLTLSQYKEMKNLDQLRAAAVSKGVNLSGDELHKFNDALELLEKNLSKVKYTPITGSYSQGDNMYGGGLVSGAAGYADPVAAPRSGGADEYPRSTMDKRVADRKKLRNLIYETFVRQLNAGLDKLVGALDVLSMKIGSEIPISDQLDGFRQALSRVNLGLARKKQVYLALIGYYNDAMSKSKRDQVVGELKMVSSFIDSIVELPMYRASAGFFQAVQLQIKGLLDIIGKYADEIAAKFGRGEDEERKPKEGTPTGGASMIGNALNAGMQAPPAASSVGSSVGTLGGAGPYEDGKSGGGASMIGNTDPNYLWKGSAGPYEDGKSGGASMIGEVMEHHGGYSGGDDNRGDLGNIPAPKFRATKTLDDATRQFDYRFRTAQIRANLSRAGAELSHYGEKYEKITANSLADILRKEQDKYKQLLKNLSDEEKALPATAADAVRTELKEAKKFLDGQWEAKKKFWAVAEAIDGYMRAFTNGFVNNPSDIKDIRAILDDVEVIRDWYSEASGNQLASVFDHFPSSIGDAGANTAPQPTEGYTDPDDDNSHYYQKVGKMVKENANDLPGNPNNVTTAASGNKAREMLKRMLASMTALKNILSVFVHFGSKFGGNDLNKITFLTPAQIYNHLLDYLQASSFQQGFGIFNLDPNAQFTAPAPGAALAAGNVNSWNATGNAVAYGAEAPYTVGANPELSSIRTTLNLGNGDVDYGVGNANPANADAQRRRHWGVWMRSVNSSVNAKETPFNFKTEDEYFVIVMKSIAAKILTVTGMYDVMDRPHEFNGITPIRMIMGGDDDTPKVDDGAVALYLRLPLLCQFWRVVFNFDERDPPEGENKFTQYNKLPMRDTNVKISMVPDVDGTFAGLIRLMFRKHKYLDTSAYSDSDIKDIIRECNMIYQKMVAKHPQNTVMETIYELIAEVNRRYGVVSKTNRDTYETEFGYRYDYASADRANLMDRYSREPDPSEIALLPGEDEEAIARPSAAERLLEGTDFSQSEMTKKSRYTVDIQHNKLIKNFRCVIDNFFENPKEEYSFNGAIKSTQNKLKRETRDEERFKIVASLVRGVDVYSKVDGIKYLLFHETVVAGLNVLSGIHSMLARFQARAKLMDINWIVNGFEKYLEDLKSAADNEYREAIDQWTTGIAAAAASVADVLAAITGVGAPDRPAIAVIRAAAGGAGAFAGLGNAAPKGASAPAAATYIAAHTARTVGQITLQGFIDYLRARYVIEGGSLSVDDINAILNNLFGNGNREAGQCVSGRNGADNSIRPTYDMQVQDILKFHDRHGVNPDIIARGAGGGADAIPAVAGGVIFTSAQPYHLSGVLDDVDITRVKSLFYNDRPSDVDRSDRNKVQCFFRYLLNREFAMKESLESLFGLSSDLQNLVNVRIDDGKLYMNTGGLKTLINELFDQVSYFVEVLRPHVRASIMSKYVSKLHAGSLYWLQEQLLEKIIVGRPAQNAPGGKQGYANIDDQMRSLSDLYQWLTREFDFNGQGLQAGAASVVNPVKSRNSFDKVFASLIFYDGELNGSGLLPSNEASSWDIATFTADTRPKLVDYNTNPYEALHLAGPPGAQVLDTRFAARFYQLYSWKDELTLNRSALFVFNQLVAKFVQSFYDPGQKKMYKGLIDQFANGTFNRAINDHRFTYPDVAPVTSIGFSGPTDLKVEPDLYADVDQAVFLDAWRTELGRFIRYITDNGTKAAPANDLNARSTMFRPDPANVLAFHREFLLYTTAVIVEEYLRGAPVIPNNAAFNAICNAVVIQGGLPPFPPAATKTQIAGSMRLPNLARSLELLRTPANPATPINALVGPAAGGTYLIPAGILAAALADGAATPKMIALRQLQATVIRTTGNHAVVDDGSVVLEAFKAFPYNSNAVGSSPSDTDMRARMLADLMIRIASDSAAVFVLAGAINANVMKDRLDKIRSGVGSRNAYSTGRTTGLKYLIKMDDLSKANTTRIAENNLNSPSYEENVLLFARRGAVPGGIDGNSTAKLGVPSPAGQDISPLDDDFNRITAFGRRADPDAEHVLFTSLAVVIRNLVHTRTAGQTQNLMYMTENMADVPIYVKEKMRANLPAFKNLFRELVNRCEFLKKFMMRREMDLNRFWVNAPAHNPWPWVLSAPVAGQSESAKDRFSGILDTIVRGSQTLIAACETVLKEVGDDPKYLELYSGSIRDYRAQYGVDPLMPVSSMLAMLRNVDESTELDFFPIRSLGELKFKHMYSGRSLLQNMAVQPTAESVPGWTQTLESFNLMVDGRLQADSGHAEGMLKALTKGARYLYDLKRIKGLLTPHLALTCVGEAWFTFRPGAAAASPVAFRTLFTNGSLVRADLVSDGAAQITNKSVVSIVNSVDDSLNHLKPTFSIKEPLTRVVMLTESSNKDDQLKLLVDYISGDDKKNRSHTLAVQNIIDLNIIPINVHALMREIPLANLYNYAYTYERMIVELFYGSGSEESKKLIASLCNEEIAPNSPKDMLVKLLLNPYYDLYTDYTQQGGFRNIDSRSRAENVQGMLLGATGEDGIGRPKFLSDQVYGKAIFGELYNSWEDVSDMGPAVRYARFLTRDGIATKLPTNLLAILNRATGVGGKFKTQGAPIAIGSADEFTYMFLDDQTTSIEALANKIAHGGLAAAVAANNRAFHIAIAIITKTVGSAFLWAANSMIKRKLNVGDAERIAHSMIDALGQLGYDAAKEKLDTTAMRALPIDGRASSPWNHILSELDKITITNANNPLGVGAAVRNAGAGDEDLGSRLTLAVNERHDPADAVPLHVNRSAHPDMISLHYMDNGVMKTVAFGDKRGLAVGGRARFDTVLIRNLTFIVNLYRSVRLKLQKDLTYSKDIITKSLPITRNQLTEFSGNASLSRRGDGSNLRYE